MKPFWNKLRELGFKRTMKSEAMGGFVVYARSKLEKRWTLEVKFQLERDPNAERGKIARNLDRVGAIYFGDARYWATGFKNGHGVEDLLFDSVERMVKVIEALELVYG